MSKNCCDHNHFDNEQHLPASEKIRKRIEASGKSFFSNENISEFILPGELEQLQKEVEMQVKNVLKSLVIDIDNDHNTQDTAKRVAKMYINEIFSGRYSESPSITAFPNAQTYDQLYVTGPITIRSTCAHHLQNIIGKAYVGIYPGEKVIGLSKFNRIAEHIASRPQIQEELTVQLADTIEKETEAKGVIVLIQAEHHCMTSRGVKEHDSAMTTSVVRGEFKHNISLKQEFFDIVHKMP